MNKTTTAERARRVYLETPDTGHDVDPVFAAEAMVDSYRRGEAPLAGFLILTGPKAPPLRHAWLVSADLVAVYLDLGCTPDMHAGVEAAVDAGVEVEYRFLWPVAAEPASPRPQEPKRPTPATAPRPTPSTAPRPTPRDVAMSSVGRRARAGVES